jgi:16S rRNA C1402 N4-methylase RsmH
MNRFDLHIKITVDLDEDEQPERIAREICRQLEKMYVVRSAELSSIVEVETAG